MYTQDTNVLSSAPTLSADTVLFNTSKKELYVPSSGYKTLQNRLKINWNVGLQRDDITLERLSAARLVIFGAPRDKFSASEVCSMIDASFKLSKVDSWQYCAFSGCLSTTTSRFTF